MKTDDPAPRPTRRRTLAPRIPLPSQFEDAAFAVQDAVAAGLSRRRLDHASLSRPFSAIRVRRELLLVQGAEASLGPMGSSEEFADLYARARARDLSYAPNLREGQAYGGISAARILGLPLPVEHLVDERVHVVVPKGRNPPRGRGVVTRSVVPSAWKLARSTGVPVPRRELLWCLLARDLGHLELVQLGDALVSTATNYPGRAWGPRAASIQQLRRATEQWRGCVGVRELRDALPRLRHGVESPWETTTRLALVDSGYPEPAVNHTLRDRRRFVARGDLADLEARVIYDYEGDGHRTSKRQFRRDISRSRAIRQQDWEHVRLTVADLVPDASEFVAFSHSLRRMRLAQFA